MLPLRARNQIDDPIDLKMTRTFTMDDTKLRDFGTRYTAAWCSQSAASVAAFFTENGSLQINQGAPSVGRAAITSAAQGFMTAFPDMVVVMDAVSMDGSLAIYRWRLTGTNSGPAGTGRAVRITGHEEWTFGADGLIAASKGHFDEAEYARQVDGHWDESLDALVAAPAHHRLLFENAHVRVLDTRIAPGERTPVHTHRWPAAHYVLGWSDFVRRDSAGTVLVDTRVTNGGRTPPQALWGEALAPHSLENVGATTIHIISTEIKSS
jgi:hypothetical protein